MNKSTSHLFVALGLTTILKGPFKDLDRPFLNGLGGKIEDKERITAAAQRECKEECGKLPAKSRLFYCGYVIVSNQEKENVKLHVFRWKLYKRQNSFPIIHPRGEHDRFDWYRADGRYMNTKTVFEGDEITATILPSDKCWLVSYLYTEKPQATWVRVNDDFTIHGIVGKAHAKPITYRRPKML